MVLKIELPEEVSRVLEERWGDLPRHVVETLAIEGYRDGTLAGYLVQRMLGLGSALEVDAFMKSRKIPLPYDVDDLEQDASKLQELRPARKR